jgi:hypothetical protein
MNVEQSEITEPKTQKTPQVTPEPEKAENKIENPQKVNL